MNQDEELINLLTCVSYYLAAYYYGIIECIYNTGVNSERASLMYLVATAYLFTLTTFNTRRLGA